MSVVVEFPGVRRRPQRETEVRGTRVPFTALLRVLDYFEGLAADLAAASLARKGLL